MLLMIFFVLHIQESPIENVVTWWEEVNTAAIGVILGVGIGASCLALPAYANFLVRFHFICLVFKNFSMKRPFFYLYNTFHRLTMFHKISNRTG